MYAVEREMESYVLEMDIAEADLRLLTEDPCTAQLYLAEKLRACEVSERKLGPEDRELFNEAKARELSQFLHQEAMRKVRNASGRAHAPEQRESDEFSLGADLEGHPS